MSLERARRRRAPTLVFAFTLALALSAVVAGPASAYAGAALWQAFMGDCQFFGAQAGANKTVKIEWRDASGDLKSKHSVLSNGSGDFVSRCEPTEAIETLDTIKLTVGTKTRTITVPVLTAQIDRTTDTVSGFSEPNHIVHIDVFASNGTFGSPTQYLSNPSTNGSGFYTMNFSSQGADIRGYDFSNVSWTDGTYGDVFVRQVVAEGMQVWVGRANVAAVGNPGTSISLSLKDGLTIRSQTGGYLWEGNNGFLWYDANGNRVRAAAGNEVVGDFAPDADITLPTITAVANKATDRVTANCGLGAGFGILVDVHTRDFLREKTRAGVTPNFVANFAVNPKYDIKSGDKVDVYCKLATGDIVARTFTVP